MALVRSSFALLSTTVVLTALACSAPDAPATKKNAAPPSTAKTKPVATLPGAKAFERAKATFVQGDAKWTFVPTDTGYAVFDREQKKPTYVIEQKGRSFRLRPTAAPTTFALVLNWQPLGIAIGRQELGNVFLSIRLEKKGWVVHRPGKVEVATYHGPLLRLGSRAATARADSKGVVHAKIAGRPEVTHQGPLAAREVVLTLLPDLNLVEAATVALFFAEERW